MILNIKEKDPLIYKEMEKFDFSNPPTDPIQLAHDLSETVIAKQALGLAANQCGLPYRAFVIKSSPMIVCFNPKIIDESDESIYLEEGCLSFENLVIKIKRPETVKVRYTQPNGETVTKVFSGLTARVFQHELDHLNGVTMIQRASPTHLQQARAMAKKLARSKK